MTFDDLDTETLRRRRGKKWHTFEPDILPAWVADMDFRTAPAIERRLRRVLDAGDLGYPHDDHVHRLIDLFVRRCDDRFRWSVDPAQVGVIADVVQGIQICLQMFTRPGEGVSILTPIYPPFLNATRAMGRRADCCLLQREVDSYEIDWDTLASSIKPDTRVLLLCHPHNPTGRVFSRAELNRLGELAHERDLVVVSDEIHADLVFHGNTHIPFASLGPELAARTVTLMSATKSFNIAGLRCAVMVFGSPEHHDAYRAGPRFTRGAACSLGLHATEAAWDEGDEWLSALMDYLESNRDFIEAFLAEHLPAVRFLPPQATYLAWLDCEALGLGDRLHDTLFERGRLALSDGREFGPGAENCVRLNFGTSRGLLAEALNRLRRALTQ